MEMQFVTVDLDGRDHKSAIIQNVPNWDIAVRCAVVFAHETSSHCGPVKIKAIKRIDCKPEDDVKIETVTRPKTQPPIGVN